MSLPKPVPPDLKPSLPVPALRHQEEDERLSFHPDFDRASVWTVRIPRFLYEKWERIRRPDVLLGDMLIDRNYDPPRVFLELPPDQSTAAPDPSLISLEYSIAAGIPDRYELRIPEQRAKNTFVFSELAPVYAPGSGSVREGQAGGSGATRRNRWKRQKAKPQFIGKVAHEATAQPVPDAKYLALVAQRQKEGQQTRHPTVKLEDTGLSQGQMNQLAGGYTMVNSKFGQGMVTKTIKSSSDKNARLDQLELTDRLFQLFSERPYWSFRTLRDVVQQPDVWLREVLRDMAEQVREGVYTHMWTLKANFQRGNEGSKGKASVKGEAEDVKMEGEEDEEGSEESWDEEDEEELEEVIMR